MPCVFAPPQCGIHISPKIKVYDIGFFCLIHKHNMNVFLNLNCHIFTILILSYDMLMECVSRFILLSL